MSLQFKNIKGTLIAVLLISSFFSYAQNITITGVVNDSYGVGLEMANVVAVNQETKALDGFGITNSKGQYKVSVNANATYSLKFSFIGFQTKELSIQVGESDITRNIELDEQSESLDEVEVVYEMPVTIKGDTIVYNSDSFSTGTEKKLEDVLKKLPGVEINDDGEIEVEGNTVTKVMVNGKDFFDGDSKLAAKNIPANALDKIEVLRNFTEVSQLKSVTNNQDNVAINIKLKEGKEKFWFGEVTAGVGPDSRYLAHPKLFFYSPKFSLNVLTDINNIGEISFTSRDYRNFTGGFRSRTSNTGTSFTVSEGGLGLSTLQNNKAKEINTKFGAVNFSYAPTESLDLSGYAIYSYSDTDMQTIASKTYTSSDVQESTTTGTNQKSHIGLLKLGAAYNPNANLQLEYEIMGKFSDENEDVDVLSVSDVTDQIFETKKQTPTQIKQNANAYYTINEKNIFAFETEYLIQNEDPFYNAIRDEQPFASIIPLDDTQSNFNINQDKKVKTNKFDFKSDYYLITGPKSNLNFTLGATQSKQTFNSYIFQILDDGSELDFEDSDLNNDDVDFTFSDVYLGFHYKLIAGKFTINPGVIAHSYTAKNEQLGGTTTDDFLNVVPDLFVNFQLKSSESIRFNYTVNRQFSDIEKYASAYIFSNYNSIYRGNSDLESALYHNLSLNFFSFNMFNMQNIFANVSYSKRIDAFKNNSEIIGINQVTSTINSNLEDDVLSGSANFQRTFGKIKVSTRASLSYSNLNNIVNDEPSVSESFTQSYKASLATSFKNAPNIELGYNYSINDYNNGGTESTYFTETPYARFDAAFLKNFIFLADFDYYSYYDDADTIDNKYGFLDTSLSYQKKDSKWEYSIEVTNLLDNQEINQDSYNELYFSTSMYVVQPRYTMLKIKYEL
ncbi:outer membrane beta-barrel protein [Cellulophaga baltica]|uniref:outer membrane beta-barrel protein n=1 Tax=Cellulophaga TaxID=104264 RepID=UPI001C0767D4|nr:MULTISPECIES: outer membrane beta-barrel protein [Cellulophaga]MBU2995133.1 outer membrane beta-barrel protein [Cellulophaga baltica]MDO6766528.1 outer membrane beta-barrel protein [Cellulophaga sp. 1_MG-2023]